MYFCIFIENLNIVWSARFSNICRRSLLALY